MLLKIFGNEGTLNLWQMGARAFVTFFIALILIRIAGRRSFGIKSAFDTVITFLLGAILSRGVVGASPYFPIVFSCLVIVLLHRFFAWVGVYSFRVENALKGKKILLYKNGKFVKKNLARSLISKEDILEGLRMIHHSDSLDQIESIYMERNGHISATKKSL